MNGINLRQKGGNEMGEKYSVTAVLSAIDRNFSAVMQKASDSMAIMKAKAETVSPAIKNTGKVMAGVGTAITALGVSSVKSFGNFEKSINSAAIIAGGSQKDIKGLSNEAIKLGQTLPISAQEAGDAMTEMARNGAGISELKNEFPAIAKAAAVTGEGLESSAITVQNAMNIWGGGAKNAAKDSAILAMNANKSKVGIEDMGQVFANVGSTAHTLGFSVADVSTATGIMANSGLDAAQGSQDLAHALNMMTKPTDTAAGAMKQLGISYTKADGSFKSMPEILKQVSAATDGMSKSQKIATLNTLFGAAGQKAMLPLLDATKNKVENGKTVWDDYSDSIKKVGNSSKAANKYLSENSAKMTKNVGSQVDQMKDAFTGLQFASLEASSEGIQKFLMKVQDFVTYLQVSKGPLAEFARGFIALAPVFGPIILGIGGILIVISKLISAASTIGAVLANPWFLVIAAIVAVGAALWAFFTKTEQGRAIWQSFTTFLTNIWNTVSPTLIAIWNDISSAFTNAWNTLAPIFTTLWNTIVTVFQTAITAVQTAIAPLIPVISGIFNALVPIIMPIIGIILTVLVGKFTLMIAKITIAITTIVAIITAGITILGAIWTAGWQGISASFTLVWTVISTIANTFMAILKNVIALGVAIIRGDWRGAWNAIRNIFNAVWSAIKTIVSAAINFVKSIISAGVGLIKSIWNAGIKALSTIAKSIWDTIRNLFKSGVDFIKKIVHIDLGKQGEAIMNSLLEGLTKAWGKVKDFVGGIGKWIGDHKGPISYDRKLLIPAGNAIMLGLNEGLTKQFKTVQSNVTSMAGQIANSVQNATPILDTKSISNGFNRIQSLSASVFSGNMNGSMTLNASTMDQQNNRLLQKLVDKNQDIYVDRDRWVGATSDAYDGALGNNSNNSERWRM